ncbi:MAG: acetylglutamate kinase [Mobiluncus porci]|uniref:Acetylglutamate kinase n=1 Tax=Mobiluncus porci TaxID=2652278 RepID=A0A7K0K4Z3_9ACTO|nr:MULTISPECIES: acetylglutamate kinase [Mobiluncus]MCI6585079.1 acetylglutamate kinase [Mobiluncus sp.]MDD7542085.1 acetylglutamate kinase [Mobiluncus porci]MDY5749428.1 acetylglutamate kinase [Mobiluncus porci]MST50105.1 acetylglutamate kinase [Mobiluncus porci]
MAITPLEKTEVLLEAMPWLQSYRGSTVVIKYGGNAMINDALRRAFAKDIMFLHQVGLRPVVVHGGGPQITEMLDRLGLEAPFIDGYRVTTPAVMDVVRMVLTGKVQRELVGLLNVHESLAVGISGEDAALFQARKRRAPEGKDLGLVGDIVKVHPEPVLDMLDHGRIPVISSVAPDDHDPNTVLNVNADAAASALAVALKARKLVVLTDVEGLYRDINDKDSLIRYLTTSEVEAMLPTLSSGMIPKMRACVDAVRGGAQRATIIDGRIPHSMLLEIVTNEGTGTEVIPDDTAEKAIEFRAPH